MPDWMSEPTIIPRANHTLSRSAIDPDALKVLNRLRQADYVAYLVGGSVRDLLPPSLVDPTLQHIARTLESGTMQVFEFQMPVQDSVGEFEARLVVSGEDEVLAIVRDNTARKALERHLADL